MVLAEPTQSARTQDLADEDAEILERAVRIAFEDPTYLQRVRTALETWKARH